jgi:hypothetical protein
MSGKVALDRLTLSSMFRYVSLMARRDGWKVLRIWEHDLKNPRQIMSRLMRAVSSPTRIAPESTLIPALSSDFVRQFLAAVTHSYHNGFGAVEYITPVPHVCEKLGNWNCLLYAKAARISAFGTRSQNSAKFSPLIFFES